MPSWNDVQAEIFQDPNNVQFDAIRQKYIQELSTLTGRNVIAYYSNFLKRPGIASTAINDDDKNAFMATVNGLDKSKGLDLILHTPGGDIAATESLVDYLHKIFDNDIRAIVPQIAMSAGTMIACACNSIVMGKQSSLGPIDPQINGFPSQGVIAEFEEAIKEIDDNPASIPLWQTIISRYHPTFIGECKKANMWSKEIVTDWLTKCMFSREAGASEKIERIVSDLSSHETTKNHIRHIPIDKCKQLGLVIEELEEEGKDQLQDIVLSIHHAFMITFASVPEVVKIVENQIDRRMIISEAIS